MYNSIIYHLYIALCILHRKSSLLFLKKEIVFTRKEVNLILFEVVAREILGVLLEITKLQWVKS